MGKPPKIEVETFDPEERRREKQAAREKDDEDLRTGKVTAEQLRKRNGFFSSLDFTNSRIRFRGRPKL